MTAGADSLAAVVLAGGQASRLGGGDKTLRMLGERSILDVILERLRPQAGPIAISANGDPARFATYGLPILADEGPAGTVGPLAGILSALAWAGSVGASRVLTVAGDTPFFPHDLTARLDMATKGLAGHIAVAASAGRVHPVFSIWPVTLEADMRKFVGNAQTFSVTAFQKRHGTVSVDFPAMRLKGKDVDPFFNINTPDDLAAANAMIRDGLA